MIHVIKEHKSGEEWRIEDFVGIYNDHPDSLTTDMKGVNGPLHPSSRLF